tara:strand:+ start:599 stop:2041 length:1443 start_codon:yes stop_codon:yes gene_type:complete
MGDKIVFYNHQKETIQFGLDHPRSFNTGSCGTGKSLSSLETWRTRNHNGKLLVIAPKSTLEAVWYNDARKLMPDCLVGWFNRVEQYKDPTYIKRLLDVNDIVIANIEAVDILLKQNLTQYTDFIIDEFTAIKNRTAARSKNALNLSKQFDNITLLSGTPTPNGVLDIWHPTFLLDQGQRLGHNFFNFRNAVCQPIMKSAGFKQFTEWKEIPGAADEVATTLRDINIRHVLEDVVDMPDRVVVDRIITMPDTLRKQYNKMKADCILQLETPQRAAAKVHHAMLKDPTLTRSIFNLDTDDIVAVNKAVLAQKLLQIASGSAYLESGGGRLLDTTKYELIVDMVEERPASLVFFLWQHQRDALAKILKQKKVAFEVIDGSVNQTNRAKIIADYQSGKYKTLLLQPAAAAHGITLTRSVASIWCSPTYNLEHYIQANHRDYRIGQTKRSEIIRVQYADTIEGNVYERLQEKNINLNSLLDILKS